MDFLALDLSLSNSGGCVFENNKPTYIFSIPTNSKQEHRERLKIIGDFLLEVKNKYKINLVILEGGFSRFNASTQSIFKTIGVASYIYSDCEQISYAPSTVKKTVTGNGRSDKMEVEKYIYRTWPNIRFENSDQSDACAVGLCHLIKEKIIKFNGD